MQWLNCIRSQLGKRAKSAWGYSWYKIMAPFCAPGITKLVLSLPPLLSRDAGGNTQNIHTTFHFFLLLGNSFKRYLTYIPLHTGKRKKKKIKFWIPCWYSLSNRVLWVLSGEKVVLKVVQWVLTYKPLQKHTANDNLDAFPLLLSKKLTVTSGSKLRGLVALEELYLAVQILLTLGDAWCCCTRGRSSSQFDLNTTLLWYHLCDCVHNAIVYLNLWKDINCSRKGKV